MADVRIAELGPAERTEGLIRELVDVWQASVEATHAFLDADGVARIRGYVPQALAGVSRLAVASAGSGGLEGEKPIGFMGVEGGRLEMLFLAPEWRGRGVGGRLLRHGMSRMGVTELTVNEQNPDAVGFYEHLGFRTFRRSEKDEQGGPYPILYMRLEGAAAPEGQ